MISQLKNYFIPHEGNSHRPHFLHTKNTRRLLVAVIAFELLVYVLPTLTLVRWIDSTNIAAVLPGVLSALTNDERQDNNLNTLAISPLLTEAAERKAKDMATKGYFAHTSPEGITPWQWLDSVGYEYEYAGENLAINFSDSKDVTRAWMNSPTHRANIVKANYTEVGTGVATGMYQGRKTIFVAQVYANPKRVAVAPARSPAAIAIAAPATTVSSETPTRIPDRPSESVTTEVLGTTSPNRTDGRDLDITPTNTSEGQSVSSSESGMTRVSNLFYRVLTSPRHITNIVFYTMLIVVFFALILKVFIQFDIQHPELVTNGLRVAAVVIAIVIINNFMTETTIQISQGYDYSKAQVVSAISHAE